MSEMSVSDAAATLGVSPARVRLLVQRGDLVADRVGGRWLVDRRSVERVAARPNRAGRPFDPRAAWGLLSMAAGRSPDWLTTSERGRLADVLAQRGLSELVGQLRRRATVERWYVHPSLLERIAAEDDVVITGPRASDALAADRSALEVYVLPEIAERLRASYSPGEDGRDANLIVRTVAGPWPFAREDRSAWPSVVAVDLLDEHPDDPRCRNVATQLLADHG